MREGALPALYAATSPDAAGGKFYGPKGIGQLAGAPVEHAPYPTFASQADGERLWALSEQLTGFSWPL